MATIFSFWAVMTVEAAVGGTVVFGIAVRYWYLYCERIYLRLFWKSEDEYNFQEDANDKNPAESDEPPTPTNFGDPKASSNPIHDKNAAERIKRANPSAASTNTNKPTNNTKPSTRLSFLPSFNFRKRNDSKEKLGASDSSRPTHPLINPPTITNTTAMMNPSGHKEIVMEGYLMKKTVSKNVLLSIATLGTIDSKQDQWKRRYVILNGYGQLFHYKTRQDFRTNPKKPIYIRPVNLIDFYIRVINSLHPETVASTSKPTNINDRTSDLQRRSSLKAPDTTRFEMILIQRDYVKARLEEDDDENNDVEEEEEEERRSNYSGGSALNSIGSGDSGGSNAVPQNWIFRCDTEEELIIWTNCIKEICPSAFDDFTIRDTKRRR